MPGTLRATPPPRLLHHAPGRGLAAPARELGMGYRTAWLLVDSLNAMFVEPVVATQPGRREGGTTVTKFGEHVIERFRRMEELSRKAIQTEITALRRALK